LIISASRRTDIPAYYSEWFFNRLKEGFVLIRNPMNFHQISKIDLSPSIIDGIVLWTKNPLPMLHRIKELAPYDFYFQFTLNAYGKDVEPQLPEKSHHLIPAFQKLASLVGKERVIWRYDPILFNAKYTIDYHCTYFERLATKLCQSTPKCTISFLDFYPHTRKNTASLGLEQMTIAKQTELLERFSQIAYNTGLTLDTCAEQGSFEHLGIQPAHCIDKKRFERLTKWKLTLKKDTNQRPECGCCSSIDIGAYDNCQNACLYCYANRSLQSVKKNAQKHDPASPLLLGHVEENDHITKRPVRSYKNPQLSFDDFQ
jgi:hypothetical protein